MQKFYCVFFKGIFSPSFRLCGTAGRIFANPIIPQPLIGLQLTHNQWISKGLTCLIGRLTKILDDYCWISSPQLITKVLNLHKEKRGVYSPQAAGFAELREEYSETQFFPPTFKGASTDTQSINLSPKDSLLLSAGYLKSWLIPTEFKSWTYARKRNNEYSPQAAALDGTAGRIFANPIFPKLPTTLNRAPIDTQSINLQRPRFSCRPLISSLE